MNGDLKLRLTAIGDLAKMEEAFLHYLIQELSTEAQLGLTHNMDTKVYIKFAPIENGEDDSAYMLGDEAGTEFEVYIDDRMPLGMCIDFLIHELAHVRSWQRSRDDEEHCDEFGKSFALLYRKYLELYDLFWC